MIKELIPSLYDEEARTLESLCHQRLALRGNILMEQGRRTQDLFFLMEGTIGVYRKLRLAGKVTAVKIATVKAPVLIGEANMFLEEERNASILVAEDAKYLQLSHENFLKLKKEHPEIALKVMEFAGQVVSKRYLNMLNSFQERVVGESDSPLKALEILKTCLGPITVCSTETAKKLFGFVQSYTD